MAFPHLNSRQWFWTLMLAAFLWAYVGTRTMPAAKTGSRSVMQWAQSVVKWPISTVLTPGSAIATGGEHVFTSLIELATTSHKQTRSNLALELELQDVSDKLSRSEAQLSELRQKLSDQDAAEKRGITANDQLSANVTGYGAGVGSSLITINRGWTHHVQEKMPVVCSGYVVGRVVEVGPMTSTVRLLTHPRSGVQAVILRREDNMQLLNKPCYVEGMGNGQLICRSIDSTTITTKIEKGDLVELFDPDWPIQMHFWVIGEVEDIGKSNENILRWSVKIKPRVDVSNLSTVTVLLLK